MARARARVENPTDEDLEWLIKFLEFYRPMGFFAWEDPKSNRDLAQDIWQDTTEILLPNHDLRPQREDWILLARDENRVWWQDMEADVLAGNDQYVAAFEEWARISRGTFNPTNVEEHWGGEEEGDPVVVTFTLDGKPQRIEGTNQGDYFDGAIIEGIDRLMAAKGMRFAAYDTGDQTAYLVCLTPEECEKIMRDRGVKLAIG